MVKQSVECAELAGAWARAKGCIDAPETERSAAISDVLTTREEALTVTERG